MTEYKHKKATKIFGKIYFENQNRRMNILDIGCGDGEFANKLAMDWHVGEVLGIDLNKEKIAEASEGHHGASFKVQDALKINYSKFDVIFSLGVFEYNSLALIEKIAKEMKSGAYLVFSVPNVCSLRKRIKSLLGRNPNPSKFLTYCFTFKRAQTIFNNFSFSSVKFYGHNLSEEIMGVCQK